MTASTKISAKLNAIADGILAANKTPWAVATDSEVTAVVAGRDAARMAKAEGAAGKVVKLSDLTLEVIAPVVAKPAPVAKAEAPKAEATKREAKSTVERPTKLVWHIADEMKGAKRSEVVAACVAKGIAYYTARTQYQQWLTVQKEMAEREASQGKK